MSLRRKFGKRRSVSRLLQWRFDGPALMFKDTGCDGIMVGRGAIRNPWLLLQISQVLAGQAPVEVTADERQRVLIQYLDSIRDRFRSERGVLGRFKKISNYFTKGLPHGSELRVLVLRSQSIEEAVEKLDAYFDRLRSFESGDREAFIDGRDPIQGAGAGGNTTAEQPLRT